MLDHGECERMRRLLMESIRALCRNSLHYQSQFCVEGLLGITLDGQDVFLVNIKESGVCPGSLEPSDGGFDKPHSEGIDYPHDPLQNRHTENNIISKPLTPMGGFREMSRKRRHPASGLAVYQPEFEQSPEKIAAYIDSPYNGTHLVTSNSCSGDKLQEKSASDIKTEIESKTTGPRETLINQQPWSLREREATTSLHLRDEPSASARSPSQVTKAPGPLCPVSQSHSSESALGFSSSHEQLELLSPDMKSKVRRAVLKEDGCFVTSRMLCRRYSNLFKAHNVVDAMQQLTTTPDDPEFIGEFRRINDRTKVFYKAPPHLIREAALEGTKISPHLYAEIYQRMPRSKGVSKTTNWYGFVEQVLEQSPYGGMALDSLVEGQGEEAGSVPNTPVDTMDEFTLQQAIVHNEGCFVSTRILCRKVSKAYKVSNVLRAMQAMSRPTGDKHYIGEFQKISDRVKVFYKCPPALITQEALDLYGVTMETYHAIYYMKSCPADSSISNWDAYVEAVVAKYPYGILNFPFSTCGVSAQACSQLKLAAEQNSFVLEPSAANGTAQDIESEDEEWAQDTSYSTESAGRRQVDAGRHS